MSRRILPPTGRPCAASSCTLAFNRSAITDANHRSAVAVVSGRPVAYLEAHLLTGNATYASKARDTLDYLLREMQGGHGCFFSSQVSR